MQNSDEKEAAAIYMTMLTFGLLGDLNPYFKDGKITISGIKEAWNKTSGLEEVTNEKGYWLEQVEKGDRFVKTQWELWKASFVNLS